MIHAGLFTRVACVALATVAGDADATAAAPPQHHGSDEAVEVAYLIRAGTADSLATASLLAHLIETKRDTDKKPDSGMLMQRAVALAPNRPELLWLLLRDCELRQCDGENEIVARLHAADPDNALVLLPSLAASLRGAPDDTTRIIAQMGASKNITVYWNRLVVGMFDALTHGPKKSRAATALSFEADDRLSHVTGVLVAIDVPPFKPINFACSSNELQAPGRREACEKLMLRLDASDSLIAQSLSVSVQQQWWPAGTAESKALRQKSLQQHYLVEASGRNRGAQVNDDAVARVDAMRHLATEAEVDEAMLASFGEPLKRPAEWHGFVAGGS